MRDWTVPKPSPTLDGPVDWTPDPPRVKPDRVETPWGEIYGLCPDGLYRMRVYEQGITLGSLDDRIDRFLQHWEPLRPGACFHVHGDRVAILWRNRDGSYRSGHIASAGERDGVWLVESASMREAEGRVKRWWLTTHRPRGRRMTPERVAQRLGLPPR